MLPASSARAQSSHAFLIFPHLQPRVAVKLLAGTCNTRSRSLHAATFASFAFEAIPSAFRGARHASLSHATSPLTAPLPAFPFNRSSCSVQVVGIGVAALEVESAPLVEFFTPLITQPGAAADAALATLRDVARLGGAYAALLVPDLDPRRPEEALRFMNLLIGPYAPLVRASALALSPPELSFVQPLPAALLGEAPPLAVSSNFAAPPLRRARPVETESLLLQPAVLVALLRITLTDQPLAIVARAAAAAAARLELPVEVTLFPPSLPPSPPLL